jgi:polyhydroxyalkanoate synthase
MPAPAAKAVRWSERFRRAAAALRRQPAALSEAGRVFLSTVLAADDAEGAVALADDPRFADEAWRSDPRFIALRRAYAATCNGARTWVRESAWTGQGRRRVAFLVDVMLAAMAPTNVLVGNPEAQRRALFTGGASLLQGGAQLWRDLIDNRGMPAQSDRNAFRLGMDLAATPGKVVHRSEQFELLAYLPRDGGHLRRCQAAPVLLVPSMINRFYIFDLAPGRSVTEFLTGEGFPVFVISWRNPGRQHRDWNLESYVAGVVEAIALVREIAGQAHVHVASACAGGLIAACALAVLAGRGERPIDSFTPIVGLMDQGVEDTELGAFVDAATVAREKRRVRRAGLLKGYELARAFNLTQSERLIWHFFVRNTLFGEVPQPSEVLFFAGDTTHLSAGLYGDLLDLLLAPSALRSGAVELLGVPLDLRSIRCDALLVGATADRISPWPAVYRARSLLGGRTEFVLCRGGHLQPFVDAGPADRLRHHRSARHPADPQRWLATARAVDGSWWPYWAGWLRRRARGTRTLGTWQARIGRRSLGFAPGSYVFQ